MASAPLFKKVNKWPDVLKFTRVKQKFYEGPEPGTLVQYFKDDATAFNAKRKK